MPHMAKRRRKAVSQSTEGRIRAGINLNVYLPDDLMRAFLALCAEEARTKTAQLTIILRDYLRQHGRWPAQPPA